MAGVSMKNIKGRIRSMESTKQITKAMEMVAASKLRHAQERVMKSRPYFEVLQDTYTELVDASADRLDPFLLKREVKKTCYVVFGGDRGLAGGYNHNVFNLAMSLMEQGDSCVVPIGKRAVEYFRSHGAELVTSVYNDVADVSIGDCFTLAKLLVKTYLKGEFDAVYLVYTKFHSILSQTPESLQLLPLQLQEKEPAKGVKYPMLTLYEPGPAAVFHAIIPECLGGMIYSALCESVASELGARRTAMDAATKNAEDMIDSLSLQYNRARQGAITQQITEIVSGAEQT